MSDASNASDEEEECSLLLKSLEKSNDAMAVFLVATKWIPRSIHPFLNLTRVIYAGFQDADEVDVTEIEEPLEEELAANSLFMKLVPHFERVLKEVDVQPGLLHSFIKMVYRHIFTSPSSAIGKVRKGTKPSKAQIYGMKCASGRTITYACVQTRFLLSNLSSWSTVDGHFDLHAFYNNIFLKQIHIHVGSSKRSTGGMHAVIDGHYVWPYRSVPVFHAIAVEVALATCKMVLAAAAINTTPPTPPTPPPMTTNLANTPSAGMSTVVAAIPPLRHLKMHMPACPKGDNLIAGQVQMTMMTVHHAISHGHARNWYHARPITWDVSQGSNLGHGRRANLSWPIGDSHGHLWPYVEPELFLMWLKACGVQTWCIIWEWYQTQKEGERGAVFVHVTCGFLDYLASAFTFVSHSLTSVFNHEELTSEGQTSSPTESPSEISNRIKVHGIAMNGVSLSGVSNESPSPIPLSMFSGGQARPVPDSLFLAKKISMYIPTPKLHPILLQPHSSPSPSIWHTPHASRKHKHPTSVTTSNLLDNIFCKTQHSIHRSLTLPQ
ncbi:uncharacterized protein LACBIDRAFT_334987 [Laccaria bicolor S238N-H82]|uniref:Predicted protein n=1 Tax=Laccaria bicolor (strain S238N-H82 / ATCC MYA-4686) TaxID=486041 RepID=B0E0Z9_LACBS|nr:uncharacterized protein LACBIDRAFT_334987 [Laccaria bicolor S238N-H82]EDQ99493.1 predicted protein [Laccaria bicolor S238N-H82]|eukprot:XP_001889842.1 predicted protein [Laccaria bicolor S238N-H82]